MVLAAFSLVSCDFSFSFGNDENEITEEPKTEPDTPQQNETPTTPSVPEIIHYTITFDSMGGTNVSSVQTNAEGKINLPTNPTKKGFIFVGWYWDQEGKNAFDGNSKITGNTTLYAKWEAEIQYYTVTFNSQGGSAVENRKTDDSGKVSRPNNPFREGFIFVDWYSDTAFMNVFDFNKVITRNITLYAKWIKEDEGIQYYTVTFDSQGGSSVSSATTNADGKVTKPLDPTRKNFIFKGWFTEQSCQNEFDFNSVVTQNMILYAKWEEQEIVYEDFSIHFLELGNSYAGDCTFIKVGEDIDILIDAGSRTDSIPTLKNYINQYCKDGILEYVIVTHAHQDHIAGFTTNNGIFASYECETIIDFSRKNTDSQVSQNYISLRDKEVSAGAKHYTAEDCVAETNGAKKVYTLAENISFEVLDQEFYHKNDSDENNYSVCTLFTRGEDHFLFTGDLEEAGEESLAELNELPHVKLFKAGHHGSKTSSNEILLKEIQPENVAVCCCAGSSEYTENTDNMFPTQDFINRVAKYTDKVYVTTTCEYTIETSTKTGKQYMKANTSSYKSMNGNIVFSYEKSIFKVNCSNNNTILKDTEWFNREITLDGVTRKMRTWPTY